MNSTDILNLVIKELATNMTNGSSADHHPHSHYDHMGKQMSGMVTADDDHDHDHDHGEDPAHDENNAQYNATIAKATAMAVLFCASTFCGCIPFFLNRRFKWTERNTNARSATVVKCLLYFGGGVLLCTTFLHLLPEVKENIQSLQSKHVLPDFSFNFAELLMCLGFFAMFLVEELIHTYIHRHNKNAQTATGAFVRGVSITESILVKRKSNSSGSSRTSSTLTNEDTTKRRGKKSTIDDVEKNQSANNTVIDCLVEASLKKEQILTSNLTRPTSPGVTNRGFESEPTAPPQTVQKTANNNDHAFKKNTGSTNTSNYYSQQHEQKHHHHHHHHDDHQQHNGHGHSHLPVGTLGGDLNEDQIVASLRGLLVVLALSIHELFEGLAVGLESRSDKVWYMFGAVSAHKLVLAFCVGVELIVTRTKLWLSITYVITFAIVSPIGIGIGIAVSTSDNGTASAIPSAILQGLATGTLLYVVFFEILSKERSGLIPYASFVVGFAVMFGLQFATGHEHSHDHGHSHGEGNDHGHSHDSLEMHNTQHSGGDDIDYTKKSIQEQIEILRAAGRELLQRNQLNRLHQHSAEYPSHSESVHLHHD